MIVTNIVLILLSRVLAGFYFLPEATTDLAVKLLICHGVGCIFIWSLAFTLPNALRAAGDVKFTMTISVLAMWICRIGFSYVIGTMWGMGVLGVWIAMCLDWVFRTAFFVTRLKGEKWKTKRAIT